MLVTMSLAYKLLLLTVPGVLTRAVSSTSSLKAQVLSHLRGHHGEILDTQVRDEGQACIRMIVVRNNRSSGFLLFRFLLMLGDILEQVSCLRNLLLGKVLC